jgi:hypothetical protein
MQLGITEELPDDNALRHRNMQVFLRNVFLTGMQLGITEELPDDNALRHRNM